MGHVGQTKGNILKLAIIHNCRQSSRSCTGTEVHENAQTLILTATNRLYSSIQIVQAFCPKKSKSYLKNYIEMYCRIYKGFSAPGVAVLVFVT